MVNFPATVTCNMHLDEMSPSCVYDMPGPLVPSPGREGALCLHDMPQPSREMSRDQNAGPSKGLDTLLMIFALFNYIIYINITPYYTHSRQTPPNYLTHPPTTGIQKLFGDQRMKNIIIRFQLVTRFFHKIPLKYSLSCLQPLLAIQPQIPGPPTPLYGQGVFSQSLPHSICIYMFDRCLHWWKLCDSNKRKNVKTRLHTCVAAYLGVSMEPTP